MVTFFIGSLWRLADYFIDYFWLISVEMATVTKRKMFIVGQKNVIIKTVWRQDEANWYSAVIWE